MHPAIQPLPRLTDPQTANHNATLAKATIADPKPMWRPAG